MGRCYLQWAGQLRVLQQQKPNLGDRLLLLEQATTAQDVRKVLQVSSSHAAVVVFGGAKAPVQMVAEVCRRYLGLASGPGDLPGPVAAAAGYPIEQFLEELAVLSALLAEPAAASNAAAAVAAYELVLQQLQRVGMTLNTLAFPDACNNPSCSNMAGATELESVSGRSNICADCRIARYCSRAPCQKQHWKQHKTVCQSLAAAAAAAKP